MITLQDALAGLADVVEGSEGFVYKELIEDEGCAYSTEDGNPSCGVGVYLYRNDRELFDVIHEHEWQSTDFLAYSSMAFRAVDGLDETVHERYTSEALRALEIFQMHQDSQKLTWGECLELTKKEFPLMPVHMTKCLKCGKWRKMRIQGKSYPLHYGFNPDSSYEECLNCGDIKEIPRGY